MSTIDTNKKPFITDGWTVEKHIKGGKLDFDASKIELYVTEKQKDSYEKGEDLQKDLENKQVLNANVLDFLLKNPHLIPEDWKGKAVFFWGTIYRDSNGDLCVRYLRWNGTKWDWGLGWLDNDFDGHDPAACLASPSNIEKAIQTLKDNGYQVSKIM